MLANKAALKAMIVNRIGDFGLAVGLFFIYAQFKSLDYLVVFPLIHHIYGTHFILFNLFEFQVINIIGILLFVVL